MAKKDKYLNIDIGAERKSVDLNDSAKTEQTLKYMVEKTAYEQKCVNERKEKNQKYIDKNNSSYYHEQFLKISNSQYVLPNRFAARLYNDEYVFEPYEFLSYFENENELTFYIRLTSDNIKKSYDIEKCIKPRYIPSFLFNNKFTVDVDILNASLESIQFITYKDCCITRIDYPYFEYGDFGNQVATIKIFLKYKRKEIK